MRTAELLICFREEDFHAIFDYKAEATHTQHYKGVGGRINSHTCLFDSCKVKCIWTFLTRCTSVLWPKTDADEIAALLPYLAAFFCGLNPKCLRCKSGEHIRGRNRFWYSNTSMLQRKQRHQELRWSFVLLPNCVGWKAFFLPERHTLWRLKEEEE